MAQDLEVYQARVDDRLKAVNSVPFTWEDFRSRLLDDGGTSEKGDYNLLNAKVKSKVMDQVQESFYEVIEQYHKI